MESIKTYSQYKALGIVMSELPVAYTYQQKRQVVELFVESKSLRSYFTVSGAYEDLDMDTLKSQLDDIAEAIEEAVVYGRNTR